MRLNPNRRGSPVRPARRRQAGAMLVLIALMLAVLIAALAFGIDLAIFHSQQTKYERTAEQAALAALETYLASLNVNPDNADALAQAELRAENIVGLNLESCFGSALRQDPAAALSDLGAAETGANGRIIPGRWHFEEPSGGAHCDHPSTPFRPCFETIRPAQRANAIRIELATNSRSPLRVIFHGLAPRYESGYSAAATASLIPRRAVFAIDLSRSIVRDTHLGVGAGGTPAEYAFSLAPNTPCSSNWQNDLFDKGPPSSADHAIFDLMAAGPRAPADPSTVHCQDEYDCFNITGYTESFGIDRATPPQPLTGVLDAVHTALIEFQARSVSADLAGMLGFDDQILAMRKLDMTHPEAGNVDFQNMLSATDTARPISARKDTFLFPRYFGGQYVSGYRLPAMTDLLLTLDTARNMISAAPGFEFSENFIVLISDGMANCADPAPSPGLRCFFTTDPAGAAMSRQYVEAALQQVAALVQQKLAPEGIALHTFLIGDEVAPHYLLRREGNGCMTDDEARSRTPALDFVDLTGGSANPAVGPYYFPNTLYLQSRETGGLWSPILDCCRDAGGACTDVSAVLQAACAGHPVEGGLVACPCNRADPACLAGYPFCRYVDGNGRLRCDPKGREKHAQVIDALREIMRSNPFILVE